MKRLLLLLLLLATPGWAQNGDFIRLRLPGITDSGGIADPAQFTSPAGTIVVGGTAGAITLDIDNSVLVYKASGTADPPASCGDTGDDYQIGDMYLETDQADFFYCVAIDTWSLIASQTNPPGDDKVMVANGTTFQLKDLPNGLVSYSTSSNTFSNGGIATVSANTGTASTTAAQAGYVFTNTGDGDGSQLDLLDDPTVGVAYSVVVTVAQTLTVDPAAGETLYLNAAACATVSSSTVGAALSVVAVVGGSGGMWVASGAGWTCTP